MISPGPGLAPSVPLPKFHKIDSVQSPPGVEGGDSSTTTPPPKAPPPAAPKIFPFASMIEPTKKVFDKIVSVQSPPGIEGGESSTPPAKRLPLASMISPGPGPGSLG